MAAGAFAGMITGFLHVYLKITNLLSGILMMTALYSINLRIMGKANTPLLRVDTMFTTNMEGALATFYPVLVAFIVMIIIKVLLDLYMKTYAGLSLRAVGANEQLVSTLGQNTGKVKIIGLAMSNSLAALTGALMCQYQRFADVGMGNGTIVTRPCGGNTGNYFVWKIPLDTGLFRGYNRLYFIQSEYSYSNQTGTSRKRYEDDNIHYIYCCYRAQKPGLAQKNCQPFRKEGGLTCCT